MIWFVAAQVYPGVPFTRYAILGDDIVIGDARPSTGIGEREDLD